MLKSLKKKEKKVVVLGRGISGVVLIHRLLQEGYQVVSIDNEYMQSASRVAAGLWNPVTFKRLSKSWQADAFIPELYAFYLEVEKRIESKFFYDLPYLKMLHSMQEVNEWESRNGDEEFNGFFGTVDTEPVKGLRTTEGTGKVYQTGYLDSEVFIDSSKNYFRSLDEVTVIDATLNQEQVSLTDEGVLVALNEKTIEADQLIFANGLGVLGFPYFNWLPFQAVKGEVLTIESPRLKPDAIINKGFFVAPLGSHQYRVGATYSHAELNTVPTENGKEQLIEKLQSLLDVPFEVIGHRAGVRPAVKGRKPMIGEHPEHPQLLLFNGMGSKAVMMTPLLSKQFLGWMNGENELWDEVDVARFYSYFRENQKQ